MEDEEEAEDSGSDLDMGTATFHVNRTYVSTVLITVVSL